MKDKFIIAQYSCYILIFSLIMVKYSTSLKVTSTSTSSIENGSDKTILEVSMEIIDYLNKNFDFINELNSLDLHPPVYNWTEKMEKFTNALNISLEKEGYNNLLTFKNETLKNNSLLNSNFSAPILLKEKFNLTQNVHAKIEDLMENFKEELMKEKQILKKAKNFLSESELN